MRFLIKKVEEYEVELPVDNTVAAQHYLDEEEIPERHLKHVGTELHVLGQAINQKWSFVFEPWGGEEIAVTVVNFPDPYGDPRKAALEAALRKVLKELQSRDPSFWRSESELHDLYEGIRCKDLKILSEKTE